MRTRRTVAITLAVICAGAGGPALAAVAGRSNGARVALTETAPLNTVPVTLTQTAPTPTTTTTDATTTSSTTTTTPPPQFVVCLASARRVIARRLGVKTTSISDRQFLATNGMPQCNYLIAHAHRGGPPGKVSLTVNVDNGPQAHWRLMRKVVEAEQIFGPVPKGFRPPIGIHGLGDNASWFPALDQLMANNLRARYLLTVGVIWHGTTQAQKIAITRAVTLFYRHIRRLPA
ncbi:MAG TPA: hypothetical protein VHU61_14900 [Solirubrobacteraceae bacterium]|jgi:hypothetical protein|nr:hypothetical protein [Solirubrobacteraceae bacterium]